MKLSAKLKDFIFEHMNDDVNELLLSSSRYPDIDVNIAVSQIIARRQIKDKLPSWYQNPDLYFPSRVSVEQCSSEQTASYKQSLLQGCKELIDVTGGLGIDSCFFSRAVENVIYIERYPEYCEAAEYNFNVLQATNIKVKNGQIQDLLLQLPACDVIYIDPARRGDGNKRVFALTDCEPDLITLLPQLFQKAPKVIAKISPMADIRHTLDLLPQTTEVHVLSVKNECKELLFVMERKKQTEQPLIVCSNLTSQNELEKYSFTLTWEKEANLILSDEPENYLYEPNASIMKAGAFKSMVDFGIKKLHISSHLYTSSELKENFPGRIFSIEEVIPFSGKICKQIGHIIPQANIAARNFPLNVADLRKRTGIKDGGEIYIFATTLKNDQKVLIVTKKTIS